MHDVTLVGVVEGAPELGNDLHGRRQRKAAFRFDEGLERAAFDELHDDEAAIRGRNDIVDGDDTGVLEPRRDARLTHESLAELVGRLVGKRRIEANAFDRFATAAYYYSIIESLKRFSDESILLWKP